jgi:hypothetical protein
MGFEVSLMSFYPFQCVSPVIEFDENRGMDLIGVLPGVVAFRVALPFDQILQGLAASPSSMSSDLFHFIFFFSINQIRGRSCEIWTV